jgi:hypothetical protein
MNSKLVYSLLPLLFFLLNSCAVEKSPLIAIVPPKTSIAAEPGNYAATQFLSKGDIYKTTYQVCRGVCDLSNHRNDISFYSWGKPTTVGIFYTSSLGVLKKMPEPNSTKEIDILSGSHVCFKAKGNFEVLMKPLKDEAFAIGSAFGRGTDLKIHILSIKKVTASQLFRFPNDITEREHKNDPKVIPQQVDNITWQEGQPPQVIGVRKW